MRLFCGIAVVLIGCSPISCLADSCKALTDRDKQLVSKFVAQKYHVEAGTRPAVSQVDNSCFLRFDFMSDQKAISVFLSPDRDFITTQLFDINGDPALEEKKKAEAAMKALVADNPPTIGPDTAPVTIVEFSDFECPYCQKLRTVLEREVIPAEAGKVRIVFRNYPLPMHPWAEAAAMLAMCASFQDESSFWRVHDFLFENQSVFTTGNLRSEVVKFITSNTTLDLKEFNKCVDKDMALGMVRKDIQLGEQFGVRSTPTAFVNGVRFEGIQGAAQLISLIESGSTGAYVSGLHASSHAEDGTDARQCMPPTASKIAVHTKLWTQ